MELIKLFCSDNPLLMYQFVSVPFALLFYFLSQQGYLSLASRYMILFLGGCVLAVVTMGIYSLLLFVSTAVFIMLLRCVSPVFVHSWVFVVQMVWQTFWHLFIQHKEYYLNEPTELRLFTAVSSLMLLTQRITSMSMDHQDRTLVLPFSLLRQEKALVNGWCHILPLISYAFNFTALLGGPLCTFNQFVKFVEGKNDPPPCPFNIFFLKTIHVLSLEVVRHGLINLIKVRVSDPSSFNNLSRIMWVWCLALIIRIRYYSHWQVSECLNNAAGLGFWGKGKGSPPNWSGLSDGEIWKTESSRRVSEYARQWNTTTALWLRRLIFRRCKTAPLIMTFAFSVWWHGLHLGQFVGFFVWAAAVKADHQTHELLRSKLISTVMRLLYTCLGWLNTQMVITCVVIAVDFRSASALRLLCMTYIGIFPVYNIILVCILYVYQYFLSRNERLHN